MVTCSFIGHNKEYDLKLRENLTRAVQKVVKLDSVIEFIFYKHTCFNFLCLAAVLEARQHNPGKRITLTLITRDDSTPIIQSELFPLCAFDKVVCLPPVEEVADKSKWYLEWKKAEREIIKKSDCLVCYVYPDLRDSFNDMYEFAKHQPKLTVFNTAVPETANAIKDDVAKLETIQQYIIYALWRGHSYSYIGETLGVSSSSVHSKDSKSRRLLREYARKRFIEQRAAQEPTVPPTCAVVLPMKMDSEDETRFRQVVSFLVAQYGVGTFYVEKSNCTSEFVKCLFKIQGYCHFRVVLYTHYSDSVATAWGSTSEGFVPLFSEVINIDSETKRIRSRYFRALSALLDNSDYVISKSGMELDLAALRQIQQHKRLKAFDLGRSVEHVTL